MKLTVYFKQHLLLEHFIEFDEVLIGSAEHCDLTIDSLAISDEHCKVYQKDKKLYLEPLAASNPTSVNDTVISEAYALQDQDIITLGKHTIEYSGDPDSGNNLLRHKHEAKLNNQGCLQIMSGENLGRIIRLSKAHVKLGKDGADSALISQKTEGYFLSSNADNSTSKIGSKTVSSEPVALSDGDLIEIDGITMQFFFDAQQEQ